MTFPTVKSSPYGRRASPKMAHIWSEAEWRRKVLDVLLTLSPVERRFQIATAGSFRFTSSELEG